MAKIILAADGKTLELPDQIAGNDEDLKRALTPVYPDLANAKFERSEKDGVMTVRVVKQAGTKGGATSYATRVAKGLCQRCGLPARAGNTRCSECASVNSSYVAGRRDLRILAGLCGRCGENPPAQNRKNCRNCLLKSAEHHAAKRIAA